jgi:hypothetical protein
MEGGSEIRERDLRAREDLRGDLCSADLRREGERSERGGWRREREQRDNER